MKTLMAIAIVLACAVGACSANPGYDVSGGSNDCPEGRVDDNGVCMPAGTEGDGGGQSGIADAGGNADAGGADAGDGGDGGNDSRGGPS